MFILRNLIMTFLSLDFNTTRIGRIFKILLSRLWLCKELTRITAGSEK